MHVSDQLKKVRSDLNLSQKRFGMRIGVSGKSISAYETRRCMPTLKVLENVVKEFNVSFTSLPNEEKTSLHKSIMELESSLTQLKHNISRLLAADWV